MRKISDVGEQVLTAAAELRDAVEQLRFAAPVACVYNPLVYAWAAHAAYVRRYATTRKRAVFLGMNPGPFGMVQTGVPFREVIAVREWLGIEAPVGRPAKQHAKRLVHGFDCPRTEISGQRLWRLFAERFGAADKFFSDHFVVNYCPLAFLEASACNRTPDKLPATEREPLFSACDEHLRKVVEALAPQWVIGIGDFAAKRARDVFPAGKPKVARILHPSPASPAANRDWAARVTQELTQIGVWPIRVGAAD